MRLSKGRAAVGCTMQPHANPVPSGAGKDAIRCACEGLMASEHEPKVGLELKEIGPTAGDDPAQLIAFGRAVRDGPFGGGRCRRVFGAGE